jgi:hypothetical protein
MSHTLKISELLDYFTSGDRYKSSADLPAPTNSLLYMTAPVMPLLILRYRCNHPDF